MNKIPTISSCSVGARPAVPLLMAIFLILFFLQPLFAREAKEQDIIRVCVLKDVDALRLTLDSGYKIYSAKDGSVIKEGKGIYRAKVAASPDGILLGKTLINSESIKIVTNKDARIYVDRWRFRGQVDIFKTAGSKFIVVNYLDVEDYLYGVLYHEVSHRWPYEVLKAQAIVARTYALYQKGLMKDKPYDLTADIYSQVYGGRTSEKYRTNKAVDMTKSKVLTCNGEIFPTYYHATCGGFTEDASNLWKVDLPPLKGAECAYCKGSKHFEWTRNIKTQDIEESLKKAGFKIDGIKTIKIESRNRSNRINNLVITGNSGDVSVPGKDFRIAVGPNLLKSNNYDVRLEGNTAVFDGNGWGHGVGMCQWGAYFMACKGWKVEKILQYYYPGAEIKQM